MTKFVQQTKGELKAPVFEGDLNPTTCWDATKTAFAMLELGHVDEAKSWFENIVPQQVAVAVGRKEGKQKLAKQRNESLGIGDFKWSDFHRVAVLGGPSSDSAVHQQVGETLYEQVMEPDLENLDGWDKTPRPYYIAAFGALYLQRDDVSELCGEARARLEYKNHGGETFYRSLVNVVDAIATGNEREIESTVQTYLQDYHTEYVVGNHEGFHFVLQQLSAEATAFITVARKQGFDVHVDSEYIPQAVYDQEHYPLGSN